MIASEAFPLVWRILVVAVEAGEEKMEEEEECSDLQLRPSVSSKWAIQGKASRS